MNRWSHLALFALSLALLAACGGGGPSTGPGVLSGTLDGWPGGSATLQASAFELEGAPVILATATVAPSGAFRLHLPERPSVMTFPLAPYPCPTVSNPDARSFGFAVLEVVQGARRVGRAILADARPTQDGHSPSTLVAFVYVTQAVRVSGTCDQDGFFQGAVAYDATLEAGWNTVLLELLDRGDPRAGLSFRTAPIPTHLRWFYLADPVGPAPPPEPE
jgi:hypothetical protein